MISLALRNLLSRKRRTLLTALAVIVGVAQVSGAFVLTDSMNATIDRLFDAGQQGIEVVVAPKTSGDDSDPPALAPEIQARVAAVDGVRRAIGEVFAAVTILDKDGKAVSLGAPMFVASPSPPDLSAWRLAAGRWARGDDETALDASTAERFGYRVGDRLPVIGERGVERLRITGLAKFGETSLAGAAVALPTLRTADRLSGRDGRFDDVIVDADDGVSAAAVRDRVAAALAGERVTVRTAADQAKSQADDLKEQIGFLRPVLLVFAAIALFVGSFVIVNTFSATLAQRSRELALLRALGATRGQVTRSVLGESVLIGAMAGIIGLAGGLLIAPGILALFRAFGIDLPTQGTVIAPRTVIVSLLLGPIVTTLAGLQPVRRAASVPPIQAMRGDSDTGDQTARPGPVAWAVAALAVAGIVGSLLTTGTLAAVLVGVGALLTLVAVAWLAPLVLEPILRVVGAPIARLGSIGRLARLNAVRQPRRTATTAGALMIGVALVTFVAVFAAGISSITREAFGERVRADLALSDSASQGFPAAALQVVAADPDVRRAAGISYASFDRAGSTDQIQIAGIDPGFADVYRFGWKQGDDAILRRLGAGDVLADVSGPEPVKSARVGERFRLARNDGSTFVVTVRGIVDESNSFVGGGLIGPRTLVSTGGAQPRVVFGLIRLREGAERGAVQRRLASKLEATYPVVDALSRNEFEQRIIGQVNQLVNMIYAFLLFALLVSLLGISTTFTLTVQERRRELGMMRAVGATRRQIRRLIRLEAVLTGLLGAALGVAVGLGFAGLVARLLADDGFPYVIPVATVVLVVVVTALVAALAAAGPARRAGKIDVVQALVVD